MKKQVLWGSKPGERITSRRAPERNTIRRQKVRCSQSCLRGSRKIPRKTSKGAATKKCKPLRIHRNALRSASSPRFICRCPPQREGRQGKYTRAKQFHRRSGHPQEPGRQIR